MLRKLWLLPTAALLFVLSPLHAEDEIAEKFPYVGEVSASSVNMRSGDGINHLIMRVAAKGEELIVVAKRGDWMKVQLPKGKHLKAYVKAKFLDIEEKTATVNADEVSLRADSSLRSDVLKALSEGSTLTVISKKDDWVKVQAPADTCCWISAKFVDFKSQESSETEKSEPTTDGKKEDATTAEVKTDKSEAHADSTGKADSVSSKENVKGDKEANKGDSPKKSSKSDRLKELNKKFEERLKKQKEDSKEKYSDNKTFKKFLAEGVVVTLDTATNSATHKLESKKRVTYYLKSARSKDEDKKILFNLNDYSGKKVGIDGKVKLLENGDRVVSIEKIKILD